MVDKLRWHLGHIDALRGIAVTGVILVHSGLLIKLPPPLSAITFSGQRGVQLFFIVSAFTLFLSHENRRNEKHPLINFFIRRFFRLFPMYYLAIALACLTNTAIAGSPFDIFLSVLFIQGLTPGSVNHGAIGGWTIGAEAIFYMCLPFLFSRIQTLSSALRWFIVSAPLLCFLSMCLSAIFHRYSAYFMFLSFMVEFPVFLMGIVSYFLWKKYIVNQNGATLDNRKKISGLILILAALTYRLNLPLSYYKLYFSSTTYALLLLALCIYPWSILVNRLTRGLGKISFSVYLLHFYILSAVDRFVEGKAAYYTFLNAHPIIQLVSYFLMTLIATSLVAACTWYLIEEPGIKLGRRIIKIRERRTLQCFR